MYLKSHGFARAGSSPVLDVLFDKDWWEFFASVTVIL